VIERPEGLGRRNEFMARKRAKYKRLVLKLSGEAFGPPNGGGIDTREVESIARQAWRGTKLRTQLAVVVGGGNFVRGTILHRAGFDRAAADYMGMLATVINALALQDALERLGVETRVQTAIEMRELAEPYIRRKCLSHLEKGRIVILAAGTGNPFFTTDTTAALRATEIGADVMLKATNVDGVFSADPSVDKNATKFDFLSYMDVLNLGLKVMDSTAISLCMDNKLPIIVFNLKKKGNIEKAVAGERIGTLIAEKKPAGWR